MKKIVIFASGSGTNAQRIAEYFSANDQVALTRVYCNKSDAHVLTRAGYLGIPTMVFDKKDFYEAGVVLQKLLADNPALIVLAGFLWLIPSNILDAFPGRIINIHPALLPKFGGKGMYGSRVHEAVIGSGDKESGISIHYVNERYDEGDIIFQSKCRVIDSDTPDSLAAKIHALEYEHYPKIIARLLGVET
jgi:phosphoribosylglycinamide formyltransferase-1